MKILHTSDWHIGHTLYDYDRGDEQENMMRQIADAVAAERPDVLIVSGDIFHTGQPSASAQRLLVKGVEIIHDAFPEMTIVLTSGNHDSASRHESHKPLWSAFNTHVVGQINTDSLPDNIIEIPGKGFVAAVPYVHERNMPEGYLQNLLDCIAERNEKGLPVVMMAHTTVKGCDFGGHDDVSEFSVGGIDYSEISEMGEGYDYLALGHIHKAQNVTKDSAAVRYSGTPLPISFDETYRHTVSIVEIERHGDKPRVREIDIMPKRPLVNVPAKDALPLEDVLEMLREFPNSEECYIRLNVEVSDILAPDAFRKAREISIEKGYRFCGIRCTRRKTAADADSVKEYLPDIEAVSPMELAEHYMKANGMELDDDLRKLFKEAVDAVNAESSK